MKDLHLEPITATPVINYDNPLPKDFQSFHYKPIEECEQWSYGQLIHIHYKKPYVYATRFEGIIKPILSEEVARKQYKAKLEEILEEIRNQHDPLPF